jgi:hypothetical protein
MAKAGYIVRSGSVALTAATAKTCLMVITPAQFGLDLKKVRVSFDGVTASAVPVLCELVTSTNATNSTPGTGNTSSGQIGTVAQQYGRSITAGFTALAACTSEPTVLTAVDEFWLTPNGGVLFYDWPLGDTPDFAVSSGVGVRITAPATVDVRVEMIFERC